MPSKGAKQMSTEIDKQRTAIIDELITANNWFGIIRSGEVVKTFACTDEESLKNSIVCVMMQDNRFADLIVSSVEEYVRRKSRIELTKINPN